jgi:hypothetical protein
MDSTLTSTLIESAKNLLSTSSRFEPFIPCSHQNGIRTLNLFEGLTQITHQNLESKKLLLDSLYPAQNSQTQSKPKPRTTKDQALTQALLKLRNSKQTMRKTPGIFQPILR